MLHQFHPPIAVILLYVATFSVISCTMSSHLVVITDYRNQSWPEWKVGSSAAAVLRGVFHSMVMIWVSMALLPA